MNEVIKYPCGKCGIEYCYKNCDLFNKWKEVAENSIEKQTPKKVVRMPLDDECLYTNNICPCCEKELFYKIKFCYNCGQAIDWSE